MRVARMTNFLKGLIVIGVALVWLMTFEWFQILVRNLLIGLTVLVVGLVIWFGHNFYRRLKER